MERVTTGGKNQKEEAAHVHCSAVVRTVSEHQCLRSGCGNAECSTLKREEVVFAGKERDPRLRMWRLNKACGVIYFFFF